MPRSSGIGRTGNKHKRVKFEEEEPKEPKENPRLADLEAAVAAVLKSLSKSLRVTTVPCASGWTVISVLEQVELQARIEKAQAERALRAQQMHEATAIACAEPEAYKRKLCRREIRGL